MKIVNFADIFLPNENGITTSISNFSIGLARRGHELYIVYPKVNTLSKPFKKYPTIHLMPLPSIPSPLYPGSRISLPLSFEFLRTMREFDPDIIHFHSPFVMGSGAILLAKLLKKPLVGTFHTYIMEPEYLRLVGLHKIKLDKSQTIIDLTWKYSDMFYNQADMVISPTQTAKNDLIAKGLKPPITVISNGVDLEYIQKLKKLPPRKTYRLPEKYFLSFSRVSPEKSIDVMIEAYKLFSEEHPNTHLVIVGDGPARKNLEKLSHKLNLQKRVHFLGMIKHDDLLESNLLRNATAFITTSKTETQGMSVMEAIAYGLPVIGVNAKAVPELIAENGVICEPDNKEEIAKAMKTLATEPDLQKKYRTECQEVIERHSMEHSIDQLETLYKSLM